MSNLLVLLVDDNPQILDLAEQLLAKAPEVRVVGRARTGVEALEQAARVRPGLVLMDVFMPKMSGLEAVRRLKAEPYSPRVILMTSHNDPIYGEVGSALGADAFVTKGDLSRSLVPLVQDMFGLSGPPAHARQDLELEGSEAESSPRRTTILLVEDEKPIRGFMRHALEGAGYEILEARSDEEARHVCQHHEGSIHLALLDVALPGTNGPELAQRLLRLYPRLKILYMSGYPADALVHYGIPASTFGFLKKPFTIAALTERVRAMVAG